MCFLITNTPNEWVFSVQGGVNTSRCPTHTPHHPYSLTYTDNIHFKSTVFTIMYSSLSYRKHHTLYVFHCTMVNSKQTCTLQKLTQNLKFPCDNWIIKIEKKIENWLPHDIQWVRSLCSESGTSQKGLQTPFRQTLNSVYCVYMWLTKSFI